MILCCLPERGNSRGAFGKRAALDMLMSVLCGIAVPYLRATAARGGGAGATAGDASGDAAAAPDHDGNASSGWSSDDDEEQGGANIGLAERMLAALSNLGSSSSAAAGPASVPQKQRQQSYLSFRIGSRCEHVNITPSTPKKQIIKRLALQCGTK